MKALEKPYENIEKNIVIEPIKYLRDNLMNRVTTFDEAKAIDDAYRFLVSEYERLKNVHPEDRFGPKLYIR